MSTPEEERAHWEALAGDWPTIEWECGELWATAPTVGWLMTHRPNGVPGSFVDIGCGRGRLAIPMARAYPDVRVHGVDVAAHFHSSEDPENITWWLGDGRTLPMNSWTAAFVWSVALFQHLPHDVCEGYVQGAARVLRRGGVLAVQYVPTGEPGPYNFPHPERDVEQWVRDAGLHIVEVADGWLLPEWSWLVAVQP